MSGRRPAAVITGAASGFGLAVAEQCATRGYDLALLDIDGERVAAAAETLTSSHDVRAVGRRVDVASSDDVDRAATEMDEVFGRCDLLWSNVGVQHFGSIEATPEDVWRWVLDVNVAHGDLAEPVAAHHAAIDRALARLAARDD